MLSKKPLILILILAMAFSVHSSNGHVQEKSMPLLFALAVGKALINTPKSFIEVSSTEGVYVREANALPLFDDPQREIITTAKQRGSLMFARLRSDKRPKEPEKENIEEENEAIEWSYRRAASGDSAYSEDSDSEDSGTSDESSDNCSDEDKTDVQPVYKAPDPFQALNEISQYCATLRLEIMDQESISGREIPTVPEPRLPVDRRPGKLKVHPCNHEGCNYSSNLPGNLKKHRQTHLPADQRPRVHHCDHKGCKYSANRADHLKVHKQTHLPLDQRPKVQHCDHEGCNFITDRTGNLKAHKQTHLPAGQRSRAHHCDHEGCEYRTNREDHLKKHKQTHLPADQRHKLHQCDHEGCNHSTDWKGNLKAHKQTHLPADQRPKVHRCDHKGCKYRTDREDNLKVHKQTHLPADQRNRMYQCDHEGCNHSTDRKGNLKRHKETHLPADQKLKRRKRKAYDLPSSSQKRKRSDQE
ncbi:hypothetical protein [Endozoicomonas sp. 4G]|uniref:hypothetical protein n=1 Tax=Endozoicomonas sp. 4G TaxID=2872754 RepID=UPI00207858A7|nr:hypothetical protein [Endozoicomonas sp. 4G]